MIDMSAFAKKDSGLLTSIDFKSKRVRVLYYIVLIFMLLIAAACLFPVLWIFMSSFKDIKEFTRIPPTIIPRSFHPEKLATVWNTMNFGKYYLNTAVVAAGCLATSLVCNGLAGYVLSRLKPRGANFVFMLILWTMLMPTSVSMVPLFMTFIDMPLFHVNLTNTYVPMWLIAGAAPFYIVVFKSFFDSIPISYIEAARIDGCSNMGIFAKIMLPMSKSVAVVVGMFTINGTWGDFFWPYLIIKNPELSTVSVQIFNMKNGSWPMDVYMVSILFVILPPAILFAIFQKHIMSGFTMSGVKG